MDSVQGKMKLDITFDPRDKEKNDWPVFQRNIEDYLEEWRCAFILTENYNAYQNPGNDDRTKLKKFNHAII